MVLDSLSLLHVSSFLCKTFYQISMCEVLNFFGDCCIGIDKYIIFSSKIFKN